MINSSTTKPNTLYEQDFYLWIETTVQQLKENKFNEILIINSRSVCHKFI